MFQITKTKMINPAHIVSIDYVVDKVVEKDGDQTGHAYIKMSNQSGNQVHDVIGKCDSIELIIQQLIDIVMKINKIEPQNVEFKNMLQ